MCSERPATEVWTRRRGTWLEKIIPELFAFIPFYCQFTFFAGLLETPKKDCDGLHGRFAWWPETLSRMDSATRATFDLLSVESAIDKDQRSE